MKRRKEWKASQWFSSWEWIQIPYFQKIPFLFLYKSTFFFISVQWLWFCVLKTMIPFFKIKIYVSKTLNTLVSFTLSHCLFASVSHSPLALLHSEITKYHLEWMSSTKAFPCHVVKSHNSIFLSVWHK